jgi:Ca-activated chloride channel family protein
MPRLLQLAVPALLLAGWSGLPSLPTLSSLAPQLPAWAERWLYNPRERTARAIDAVREGQPKAAVGPADTALRLTAADPLSGYNAGTAHLAAGDRRGAVPLLEKAAQQAGRALAPAAYYNLGNARLAAGDAAGAVEAYTQALRRDPRHADAKFNLELALRQREKERLRAKAPREGQRGDREGDKGSGDQSGANEPADQRNQSKAHDPGQGEQEPPERTGADGRPLPRFRDQPEMNAQEAAALLQSVESLERQQRRQQAAQRARQRAAKGKDW